MNQVRKREYLDSASMKSTVSTMKLVSNVLGFEVVELWCSNAGAGLHCTYVYVDEEASSKYPSLITGYQDEDSPEHSISPQLCALAAESEKKMCWSVLEEDSYTMQKSSPENSSAWFHQVAMPVKSKMCFHLDPGFKIKGVEEAKAEVYLIGLSTLEIHLTEARKYFVDALGRAVCIAAFYLDYGYEGAKLKKGETDSLDGRDDGSDELAELDNSGDEEIPGESVQKHNAESMTSLRGDADAPLDTDTAVIVVSSLAIDNKIANVDFDSSESLLPRDSAEVALSKPGSPRHRTSSKDKNHHSSFTVHFSSLPVLQNVPQDLTTSDFADMTHLTDGSNSNVFVATYKNEKVTVKMIKQNCAFDPLAVQEFELEIGLLSRLDHPNIIKVLGAGHSPRRFVVLEYLAGGVLESILKDNECKPGLAQRLFRKPSFTYIGLLQAARSVAEALNYLHYGFDGVTIIHRDIKPDNIGFAADGTLKLFDFGLTTCVKRRADVLSDTYEMTGHTGSLRYMAPEVFLSQPYSETVDVYSFSLLVWQMAKDNPPYKGLNKTEFKRSVVLGNQRPKLDKNWPPSFNTLLTSCWHPDARQRPDFGTVITVLSALISGNTGNNKTSKSNNNTLLMPKNRSSFSKPGLLKRVSSGASAAFSLDKATSASSVNSADTQTNSAIRKSLTSGGIASGAAGSGSGSNSNNNNTKSMLPFSPPRPSTNGTDTAPTPMTDSSSSSSSGSSSAYDYNHHSRALPPTPPGSR